MAQVQLRPVSPTRCIDITFQNTISYSPKTRAALVLQARQQPDLFVVPARPMNDTPVRARLAKLHAEAHVHDGGEALVLRAHHPSLHSCSSPSTISMQRGEAQFHVNDTAGGWTSPRQDEKAGYADVACVTFTGVCSTP